MPTNTADVLRRLDGEAFLRELYPDAPPPDGRGEVRLSCPFHDDATPSLDFNVVKKQYRCLACGATGSAVDLLARKTNVARHVAAAHLARSLGVSGRPAVDPHVVEKHHADLRRSAELLEELFRRKGLDVAAVERWRLGWDHDRRRLVIPVRDEAGEVTNLRFYDLLKIHGKEKYISLSGRGRAVLFAPDALEDAAGDEVHIAEGELKAIGLRQLGFNALAPTGGARTWADAWNARFRNKRVVIVYDVDEAGRGAAQAVGKRLLPYAADVRNVLLPLDRAEHPHGDVLDYFRAGHSAEDYRALVDATPAEKPPELAAPSEDDPPVDVELNVVSDAQYSHQLIRSSVIVSAKDTAPYVVPSEVTVTCDLQQPCCDPCPIYQGALADARVRPVGTFPPHDPELLELIDVSRERLDRHFRERFGVPKACRSAEIVVKEHCNLEEVRLVPQLTADHVGFGSGEQSVVKAYYAGHGIETNATYEVVGRATVDPRDQHATLLISEATPNVDNLSTFDPSDEELTTLEVFRPTAWTLEALDAKLDELYRDLALNVTHIVQRPAMHALMDLVWHSVLYVKLDGDTVPSRGWVEAIVLGDSGQGKSHLAERLLRHYRLGERVDMKGASVAGLKGGLQETQNRWFVTWGTVVLNDRGLVHLDEVKGASTEVLQALTDMRSSGVAELTKIERRRALARTRKLWTSNPRSDSSIETYNFGVLALKELLGSLEDVRRFDVAMVVASNEVPSDLINAPRNGDVPPHVHDSDRCRRLLLWAWSRRPDQVVFEPAAAAACRELAVSQGKRYSASVPVVEPADHRYKLARLGAALAARTFSTDEDRSVLVVREAHIRWVAALLDHLYTSRFMGYEELSRVKTLDATISNEELIRSTIRDLPYPAETVRGLMRTAEVRQSDLMDWADIERDDAKRVLSLLVRNNALQRRQNNYHKSGPFIEMLRLMQRDIESTAATVTHSNDF